MKHFHCRCSRCENDRRFVRVVWKWFVEREMKSSSKGGKKAAKVMREYSAGKLHSGSKKGPVVTSPTQAKAIAMSEAREATKKGKK